MITRRQFIKASAATGAAVYFNLLGALDPVGAVPAAAGLADPALQPKFANRVPNALDPAFIFRSPNNKYKIAAQQTMQQTGLLDPNGTPLPTTVWGYGRNGPGGTWPGMTFVARSGEPVEVMWQNKLPYPGPHLVNVVDTSLHWAYSLPGYENYSIGANGPPIVTHLHGGHTDFQFDGNPEYFFSPGFEIRGPRWMDKKYIYHNDQPAGTLWYHDHALGITRLNVYAGLAGFYILRDDFDTGLLGNPLDLPAFPYEVALAIQDRMFTESGALFYPAFPGDPFYDDFITGENVVLPPDLFPGGGPTALAEFFGDHMLVNGTIWPQKNVEPRNYRLRLLNGCDSRFLAVQFFEVPPGASDFSTVISGPLPFTVIGSDQGLASSPTTVDTLLVETGSRYDVIIDFKNVTFGNRVIMKNIGGDEPFGGDIPGPQIFTETDRIMAFDVVNVLDTSVPDVTPTGIHFGPVVPTPTRTRKVALFEGTDEFGRLQPLLGTAEPATDFAGNPINWPNEPAYVNAGLVGQMEGSIAWHSPTTENPALGSTEEWEIWNVTGDAHPVHLHLVNFEILGRHEIGAGTLVVEQPVVQHNGLLGQGFRIVNPTLGAAVNPDDYPEYVENAPKDMVTALPGQVTRIKATFDKPGRYVWHCHILSHEDHEMMRVLHVGPGA
ncbi:MAG: multicopper oxidase domain-containing protein [Acidimicrobiia bacterium]|nr:multicopper oxidase domain-containing protein [Acidimicrobiia bacterium]